jgi:hypothetical protein
MRELAEIMMFLAAFAGVVCAMKRAGFGNGGEDGA